MQFILMILFTLGIVFFVLKFLYKRGIFHLFLYIGLMVFDVISFFVNFIIKVFRQLYMFIALVIKCKKEHLSVGEYWNEKRVFNYVGNTYTHSQGVDKIVIKHPSVILLMVRLYGFIQTIKSAINDIIDRLSNFDFSSIKSNLVDKYNKL